MRRVGDCLWCSHGSSIFCRHRTAAGSALAHSSGESGSVVFVFSEDGIVEVQNERASVLGGHSAADAEKVTTRSVAWNDRSGRTLGLRRVLFV